MSDNFDSFLEMVNVEGWANDKKSPETSKLINEMVTSREAEKANLIESETDNNAFNVEIPDDITNWDFLETQGNNIVFEDDEDWIDPVDETEEADTPEDESRFQEGEEVDNVDGGDSDIEYDPDVYEVDYSDLVTLPTGHQATIQEMADRYLSDIELDERLQQVAQEEQRINEARANWHEDLNLSALETDTLLADYNNLDWYELGQNDPVAYRDHKLHYDDLVAKKNRIFEAQKRVTAEREAAEKAKFANDAKAAVTMLKATVPGWSDALYSAVMDHAINDLGFDEEAALNEIRVPVIKGLLNSYRMAQGQKQYQAKIQRVKGANKSLQPGAANTIETDNKAQIAAKYAAGKMSQEEAFAFLED